MTNSIVPTLSEDIITESKLAIIKRGDGYYLQEDERIHKDYYNAFLKHETVMAYFLRQLFWTENRQLGRNEWVWIIPLPLIGEVLPFTPHQKEDGTPENPSGGSFGSSLVINKDRTYKCLVRRSDLIEFDYEEFYNKTNWQGNYFFLAEHEIKIYGLGKTPTYADIVEGGDNRLVG